MEVAMLVSSIPILAISPTYQLLLGLFSLRQALQDLKDHRDYKALPGLQAIRDLKGHKVLRDLKGHKVLRDLKGHKALPDHKEPKALPDHKEPKALPDHKEPKAKQALPGVPEWASTPSR
jgi:hypothetical protein